MDPNADLPRDLGRDARARRLQLLCQLLECHLQLLGLLRRRRRHVLLRHVAEQGEEPPVWKQWFDSLPDEILESLGREWWVKARSWTWVRNYQFNKAVSDFDFRKQLRFSRDAFWELTRPRTIHTTTGHDLPSRGPCRSQGRHLERWSCCHDCTRSLFGAANHRRR